MKVTLVGETRFLDLAATDAVYRRQGGTDENYSDRRDAVMYFESDDGTSLMEFAGRACYESWSKPNPDTATLRGYLENILRQNHGSVLEHSTTSFYIEGVSRSLTHELVRHRHFSYSQLSQRFVMAKATDPDKLVPGVDYVVPPLVREDFVAGEILRAAWVGAMASYDQLLERAEQLLEVPGMTGTMARKRAREVARAVLPNMTPTAIVVTGNHRAWREAIAKRASPTADAEIRELFLEIFKIMSETYPEVYQDCVKYNDGETDWVCVGCTSGHAHG